MSAFAALVRNTAPPAIRELLHSVRVARMAGRHDIQAHADLFAALKRATGLSLGELWVLHEFLPTPDRECGK